MTEPSILGSSVIPLRLIFFMWLAYFLEYVYGWPISSLGLQPRTLTGLIGIFSSPIIHGSISHLISNTVPLLFLGSTLFFFYRHIGSVVFFRIYFFTNILVWLFARSANHIGASGVVYGLAFFLIFFGFFKRDFLSLVISVLTLLLYGGVFYGVFPTDQWVSWESHLAGAFVGITSAMTFSAKKKLK